MTRRHCLALDLKDDPDLIARYEEHHRNVWPEILQSIRGSGIRAMEIYRTGNRLFMILETDDHFSFQEKAEADRADPRVQEWEALMGQFQESLPWAGPGEKWVKRPAPRPQFRSFRIRTLNPSSRDRATISWKMSP